MFNNQQHRRYSFPFLPYTCSLPCPRCLTYHASLPSQALDTSDALSTTTHKSGVALGSVPVPVRNGPAMLDRFLYHFARVDDLVFTAAHEDLSSRPAGEGPVVAKDEAAMKELDTFVNAVTCQKMLAECKNMDEHK